MSNYKNNSILKDISNHNIYSNFKILTKSPINLKFSPNNFLQLFAQIISHDVIKNLSTMQMQK